ncbi:MFS transporter [Halobacillus locisalis]|uniref:MFS transporter n=1 Tax=Halobacillus locisalis TaxID=220753 RepID=A0A838CSF8_9BACI|nr:MFS transporter [Halobacillus locisalis]MBA2174749.1 MFS transporter [Halobacillus locisalis]
MKKNTLASHNIRLLFWAELFGSVRFLQPILTLFYFARGLDEPLILVVLTFFSLGVLVGEIPTGVFADRFGAKQSFLVGSILAIVGYSLLYFAFDPWVFFLSSFLTGFAATFFSGADEALVYESLKQSNEEHLMDRAMGQIGSATFVVAIVAVIIGAVLAKDLTEPQFRLLISLSLMFMSIQFVLLLFVKNPPSQGGYTKPMTEQIRAGLQAIRETPQVLWMFINVTLVFIPVGAIFEKFDQKLLVNAGLPVFWIGIVYAIAAMIGFIASRSIGWMTTKVNRVTLLFVTGIIAVLGLVSAALFQGYLWVILSVIFLLKLVSAIRYPVYSQLSNDIIPSNVRATTISLLSILDSCFDLLVFTSIGLIAVNGFTPMFIGCAIIAFVGVLIPITPKQVTT